MDQAYKKGLELFSFEFSWPNPAAIACPNCGHHIYNAIFHRASFTKTIVILCCGSVIYWNCLKDSNFVSIFSSAKDFLQSSLWNLFSPTPSSPLPSLSSQSPTYLNNETNNRVNAVLNNYCDRSNNSICNQFILNNNFDDIADSNDYSSLNLSPLNSIGTGTLAKLDNMLDEVAEIRMFVNDSCNELQLFNDFDDSQIFNLTFNNSRRISDGELTLPSLEWDLNDVNFEDLDEESRRSFFALESKSSSSQNQQINTFDPVTNNSIINIDLESLSKIIFNKDFEFKDERFFKMKKQYLTMKQRLKLMSRGHMRQRTSVNNNENVTNRNINSSSYRNNRDSAFFEELP